MMSEFFASSFDNPVALEVAPLRIVPLDRALPLPEATSRVTDASVTRPFVNEQLNSRLEVALPAGSWTVRWRAELEDSVQPLHVLHAGARIIVQGRMAWQLFDADGKALASSRLNASEVYLDPAHSLFYLANTSGYLAARRLTDGVPAFFMTRPLNERYRLRFLARRDRRMTVVASEAPKGPHSVSKPDLSLIEVHDLGAPLRVDERGILASAKRVSDLMRRTVALFTAMQGDTLVIAAVDWIFMTDPELRIRTALRGEFEPLAMSLDEANRLYLIVREGERQALWVLTPEGRRSISYVLAPHVQVGSVPPIVGRDHAIHILARDRLITLSPEGKWLWEYVTAATPAGAAVTSNYELLLASGSQVSAFDREGGRRVLYSFAGESVRTPPVLTSDRTLLIATQRHLYCLELAPAK
ncbi:MAG: hypothetical protein V7640_273 [Betaproteobacteria bacterium]